MNMPSADEVFRRAQELQRAGRIREAADLYQQVLATLPRHAHTLNALGSIALQTGRFDEAGKFFQQAIAAEPNNAGFHLNLGTVFLQQKRYREAEQVYRQIVTQIPSFADAYSNLGIVLSEMKRPDEAVAACRQAIALNPRLVSAWANLGVILRDNGNNVEGADAYRKALELAPDRPDLLTNLGVCLARMGRHEEAMQLHRKSLQILPGFPGALNNLGICLHHLRRLDEAIDCFHKGLAGAPDNGGLHLNLAFSLLLLGRWEEGLAEYEWRWKTKDYERTFLRPRWDGSDPAGKTILAHAEQGVGDTLNFVRYAPLLAQRGAKVIVECQPEVGSLVRRTPGVEQVIPQGEPLVPHDLEIPLPSLPFALGTRPDSIPAPIPYLFADPARVQAWRERLDRYGAGVKIGIVWAGSPKNRHDAIRSMKLADFTPLAQVKGARFFSLQKGSAAMQVFHPPPGLEVVDFAPFLNSYDDTAAALANLDLLISVDTSVVHLAGAMGRPVWTMIQYSPDWRWLLERTDTPWYPTMRLFRQPALGDWDSVMAEVARELESYVATQRNTDQAPQ